MKLGPFLWLDRNLTHSFGLRRLPTSFPRAQSPRSVPGKGQRSRSILIELRLHNKGKRSIAHGSLLESPFTLTPYPSRVTGSIPVEMIRPVLTVPWTKAWQVSYWLFTLRLLSGLAADFAVCGKRLFAITSGFRKPQHCNRRRSSQWWALDPRRCGWRRTFSLAGRPPLLLALLFSHMSLFPEAFGWLLKPFPH